MAEVEDFLDKVIGQDFAAAQPMFNDIMGDLMGQSLEQEKVKLSNQVYNGVDPEQRAGEDQYELDLDDPDLDDDDDEDYDAAAEEALDTEDDDYEDDYEDGSEEFEYDDEDPYGDEE